MKEYKANRLRCALENKRSKSVKGIKGKQVEVCFGKLLEHFLCKPGIEEVGVISYSVQMNLRPCPTFLGVEILFRVP